MTIQLSYESGESGELWGERCVLRRVEVLRMSEKREEGNEGNGEGDDPTTTSSMENIIPVKQISHGWRVLQGFAKVFSLLFFLFDSHFSLSLLFLSSFSSSRSSRRHVLLQWIKLKKSIRVKRWKMSKLQLEQLGIGQWRLPHPQQRTSGRIQKCWLVKYQKYHKKQPSGPKKWQLKLGRI